jgi:hypothetical protein
MSKFQTAFSSKSFDCAGIHDDYLDALVNNVGGHILNQIMLVDVNLNRRAMHQ